MSLQLVPTSGGVPAELPTTWEPAGGRAIRWEPWRPPMRIFICPPGDPEPCDGCGRVTETETAAGKVQPHPGETVESYQDVPSKRVPGRFYERRTAIPAWPYYRLMAFRCIGCGHVDVIDVHPETERDSQ